MHLPRFPRLPRLARRSNRRAVLAVLALACAGACSDSSSPCALPQVTANRVSAVPGNVLSAIVIAHSRLADSVRVHFSSADGEAGFTPWLPASLDSNVAPVLGLRPQTTYSIQAEALGTCGATTSEPLQFTSGALPADLPSYSTGGASPWNGYVAFADGAYGVVVDDGGRVVWYHRFEGGAGLNFQAANGHYYARPPNAPGQPGRWVEVDARGRETRTLGCERGLPPRYHDLIALEDGTFWMLCDETRSMDLTDVGGVANAKVTGTVVQRVDAYGNALFEWSAFDHFAITDLDPADRAGAVVNWTDGNSFDLDAAGNLVISFASLNEITKIDSRTGAVIWRLGGRASQFAVPGSLPLFARQHGVRVSPSGELLLMDNRSDPYESRARRVTYSPVGSRSAHIVESFSSDPPVFASFGGSIQQLPRLYLMIAFGSGGRVEEYEPHGMLAWWLEGKPGTTFFRATRIPSLYTPGGYGR
jgi:hypothetical protein